LQVLAYWYDVVIPVLSETLREYATGNASVDVTQDPLDAHIRVWNLMGDLVLRSGQPTFARDLFAALLRELRTLQATRGRVHKGTPYHQIGVSMLASGDRLGAEAYFIFATVEDLVLVQGDVGALNSPASQTLQVQYGRGNAFFEDLSRRLRDVRANETHEAILKLENPELLFVEPARTAAIAASDSPR
jgi:hypothetical protein